MKCYHEWVTHVGERKLIWEFCKHCNTMRSINERKQTNSSKAAKSPEFASTFGRGKRE